MMNFWIYQNKDACCNRLLPIFLGFVIHISFKYYFFETNSKVCVPSCHKVHIIRHTLGLIVIINRMNFELNT